MINNNMSSILKDGVTVDVEGIDRMYLNVYQPMLLSGAGVCTFSIKRHGQPLASSVPMATMIRQFIKDIRGFDNDNGIEVVRFRKGERKNDETQRRLRRYELDTDQMVYIGIAQERFGAFRTAWRVNERTWKQYPWPHRSTVMCNQYYFYGFGDDFGSMFVKVSSNLPDSCRVNLNSHEYARRQMNKAGFGYETLDNGGLSCDDPETLQKILDTLDERKIQKAVDKWLDILPNPFNEDGEQCGNRYQVSVLQAETKRTQVFERPLARRQGFNQAIRDKFYPDRRPDRVVLIFNRRTAKRTPGKFSTRVFTPGVIPSLHVGYKNSRIKLYFNQERTLRTKTVINDTCDFGIGKLLKNLPELKKIGFDANGQLLQVQTLSHDCSIGIEQFEQVCRPRQVGDQRASALVFGELCAVLVASEPCHAAGRAPRCGSETGAWFSSGSTTYDLRRLRLRLLIVRILGSRSSVLTRTRLKVSVFMTKVNPSVFVDRLSQLTHDPDSQRNAANGTRIVMPSLRCVMVTGVSKLDSCVSPHNSPKAGYVITQ